MGEVVKGDYAPFFKHAVNKSTLFHGIRNLCTSSQIKKLLRLARARDSCSAYSFVPPSFNAGTIKTGIKKKTVSKTYVARQIGRS